MALTGFVPLPGIKPREVAVALATMMMLMSAGTVLGPVSAGFLQEAFGDPEANSPDSQLHTTVFDFGRDAPRRWHETGNSATYVAFTVTRIGARGPQR